MMAERGVVASHTTVMRWVLIHFVERFRLADPNTLVATQQFTDPGSFVGTAARVLSFTRGLDHVYPYDCDPTYSLAIESRQGPAAR